MNKEIFIKECKKINIELNSDQLEKLEKYKNLLIEWNKKFNLTTILDEADIYLKHSYASLCLIRAINLSNKKICDFGTGAGFPGMVIAIIFNTSKITLIESNSKKILFLNEIKNKLGLKNVEIINNRMEIYAKNNKEVFDIITCRAVSSLDIILELSVASLKLNGLFIPLKANVDEELEKSINKAKILGYLLENKINYKLPIDGSNRTILIFKKNKKTDNKYPREYKIIKKESMK